MTVESGGVLDNYSNITIAGDSTLTNYGSLNSGSKMTDSAASLYICANGSLTNNSVLYN